MLLEQLSKYLDNSDSKQASRLDLRRADGRDTESSSLGQSRPATHTRAYH
jgi:hypothetical protein